MPASVLPRVVAAPHPGHSHYTRLLRRLFEAWREPAAEQLVGILETGKWDAKNLAGYSFPRSDSREIENALFHLLEHTDFDVNRLAIAAIGRAGCEGHMWRIQEAVFQTSHSNEKLASYAIEALSALVETGHDTGVMRGAPLRYAADMFERGLHHDGSRAPSYDDMFERSFSLHTAQAIDPFVTNWLSHSSSRLRHLAIGALGTIRGSRSLPHLKATAIDADEGHSLRGAACGALADLGGVEACRVVRRVNYELKTPSTVKHFARLLPWAAPNEPGLEAEFREHLMGNLSRPHAIWALGYFPSLHTDELEAATAGAHDWERWPAALALGRRGGERNVRRLETMLKEAGSPWERTAICAALVLAGRDFADTLHEALSQREVRNQMLDRLHYEHRRDLLAALVIAHGPKHPRTIAWAHAFQIDTEVAIDELVQLGTLEDTSSSAAAPKSQRATVAPVTASAIPSDLRASTNPSEVRSFCFLHLSDLHHGLPGQRHLWPTMFEALVADLWMLRPRTGPWDAVVFTGDLSQSGKKEEYTQLNETLGELWKELNALGSSPQFVAIPGNHDLEWRNALDPAVKILLELDRHDDARRALFEEPKSDYRRVVEDAFAQYKAWWASHPFPRPRAELAGRLPGDLATIAASTTMRVGFLGLNSAFLQLTDGKSLGGQREAPHRGLLGLDAAQLSTDDNRNLHKWLVGEGADFLFLCTHHPPDWLSPRGREALAAEIAPPGRFAAHLFGHMHENRSTVTSLGGAPMQHSLQTTSLFGLEHLAGGQERRHGYAVVRVESAKDGARLRVWPRTVVKKQQGHRGLVADQTFDLDAEESFAHPVKMRTSS